MFSIGEFSKLSGLTVKTLRFYQEGQIETARVIAYLRNLEFSISDIKALLAQESETDLLDLLERQRSQIKQQTKRLRQTVRSLDQFISDERHGQTMAELLENVTEKHLA